MKAEELEKLLDRIRTARLGVLGDFCLDVYLALDPGASEISVETGLATRAVRERRASLGGAGNVVQNLMALGVGAVSAFGVVGKDPYGGEMRQLLESLGAEASGLLVQAEAWHTHVYTKLYEGEAEDRRIDFGNLNDLRPDTAERLLAALERSAPELDLLIVNQQVMRGLHTEGFRTRLEAFLGRHPKLPCIVDSRRFSEAYPRAMHKLNSHEGARLCGKERPSSEPVGFDEARSIAFELYRRWGRPLFLTRGEFGCLVHDEDGPHEIHGLEILEPVDPVGAGDSMLAGIAAALAAGAEPGRAAELGNLAAGVTVRKLRQTGTASPEEILAIGQNPDYRYRPELAFEPRRAHYIDKSEIEIVTELPSKLSLRHAIFDHDGTISTLRQGWEQVMEPMMVEAILDGRSAEAEERLYRQVVERVREYIDRTTGVQTLVQMEGLAGMVREFGQVPPERILESHGYKAVYNKALMERVNLRLAKLERGELDAVECTLKGSVPFLRELASRGIKLYLASGTDQEDVEREAALLGYAELFQGGIFGAVGDASHEPKRIVLERILSRIGEERPQRIVTFGDGPVELRETHKRGALAVGVASDEVRRYGLNPVKRTRLILAGADLIIPDFSQGRRLLALLLP